MSGAAWVARWPPLPPVALLGVGPAAAAVEAAAGDADALDRGADAAGRPVAVLRPAGAVAWVDGAVMLGEDPAAPGVLVPTARRPRGPAVWVGASLRAAAGAAAVVVWAEGLDGVLTLGPARPRGGAT